MQYKRVQTFCATHKGRCTLASSMVGSTGPVVLTVCTYHARRVSVSRSRRTARTASLSRILADEARGLFLATVPPSPSLIISLPSPVPGHSSLDKPMCPSHQLFASRNSEPAVPFRSNPERARAHRPLAAARAPRIYADAGGVHQPTNARHFGWCWWHSGTARRSPLAGSASASAFAPMIFEFESHRAPAPVGRVGSWDWEPGASRGRNLASRSQPRPGFINRQTNFPSVPTRKAPAALKQSPARRLPASAFP